MKIKTTAELQKEISDLQEQNQELQSQLDSIEKQDKTIYRQINSLLLWKSSLKVRVNIACPNKDLVGKEGYLCDLFLDGWTVIVPGADPKDLTQNNFYRLDSDYLDIVEWDLKNFEESMKKMGYVQQKGKWLHISHLTDSNKV